METTDYLTKFRALDLKVRMLRAGVSVLQVIFSRDVNLVLKKFEPAITASKGQYA